MKNRNFLRDFFSWTTCKLVGIHPPPPPFIPFAFKQKYLAWKATKESKNLGFNRLAMRMLFQKGMLCKCHCWRKSNCRLLLIHRKCLPKCHQLHYSHGILEQRGAMYRIYKYTKIVVYTTVPLKNFELCILNILYLPLSCALLNVLRTLSHLYLCCICTL